MAQNSKNNKNKQPKQYNKKNLQEKLNQQKKKQAAEAKNGCCFWTVGSLLLIVLIGFILAYDTQVNGKGVFANSACGKTLQKAGLLPYVENAWYTTMSANARAYKWAEKNIPPYAKPLNQLCSDIYKLSRNMICNSWQTIREYVSAKLPVAAEFLEQHVPGLPKKIEHTSTEAQKIFVNLIDKGTTFFKTQVFIGSFSPENLNKALNQTSKIAAEYYKLFEKKVDFYAKLK